MKYKDNEQKKGEYQRRSKTNLTKGVFGRGHPGPIVNLRVLPKHLRTVDNCNACGVKN